MVAQISMSKAALISTLVEAFLYGFSVLMFILTIWLLLRNRKQNVNYTIICIACALVTLSSTQMIVNIVRICQGFLNIGPTLPGGHEQYFDDVTRASFVAKSTIYNAQTLILDGVVIYRTYVVWNHKPIVIIFPVLGWCGLLASVIGTNYALANAASHAGDVFIKQTAQWITANYSMTLATNLSATLLLAFKIWYINRKASAYRSGYKFSLALRAVIESGAIYSLTIIVALVLFVEKSTAVYVTLDMISPIISIVYFMLIIRVRLASDGGSFATIQTQNAMTTNASTNGIRNLYEMKKTNGVISVEVNQYQESDVDYLQKERPRSISKMEDHC